MDVSVFLDEFRPFRRGEIALARRAILEPMFLHPRELDVLRYAIRLAQLSSIGSENDDLVYRIGSYRLRLLQLLAPILPTEPTEIDPVKLHQSIPKVAQLVERARNSIVAGELASEAQIDAEVAHKHLVLVLGGAAGAGYIFLGALERLEQAGIAPSYMVGCSVGSLLAVIRGRDARFELAALLEDVKRIREVGVFRRPDLRPVFGLPAALRLDLRGALGDLFQNDAGRPLRLGELAIATDVLAAGLGPGAFEENQKTFASLVDQDLSAVRSPADLRGSRMARAVAALVSLAMSRRLLVPILFGSDAETAEVPALDGAGFSAAIPSVLHYEVPEEDVETTRILRGILDHHGLAGVVDGALASLLPARYAWEAIEAGRIGSRNTTIVALDALAAPKGSNALLTPLFRVTSATAQRDKAFWDLHVVFRRAPPFMDLFPTDARLRHAAATGVREFENTARLLRQLMAPVARWKELERHLSPIEPTLRS